MNQWLPDTPNMAEPWCPTCNPERDPSRECLDVRWCASHTPEMKSPEDERVIAVTFLSGSSEAGGEDNRQWCKLLHRTTR